MDCGPTDTITKQDSLRDAPVYFSKLEMCDSENKTAVLLAGSRNHMLGAVKKPHLDLCSQVTVQFCLGDSDTLSRSQVVQTSDADLIRIYNTVVCNKGVRHYFEFLAKTIVYGTLRRDKTAKRLLVYDPIHVLLGAPIYVAMA
jgi:hypothetical protein